MGRGRAKAKQTKVARELKYHSPNTDLAALQRELAGSGKSSNDTLDEDDEYLDEGDEDTELDEDDDAANGNWAARRR
jgi:Protein of unknown function (DUF3073)